MLATKSDNPSSVPRAHRVKGEVGVSKLSLTATHAAPTGQELAV